jgi:fatty acid elongase 3
MHYCVLTYYSDYYYFATARGRKIWWKKYLTTMQITQFVIDLFAVYFGSEFLPFFILLVFDILAAYSYFAAKPSWRSYSLPTKGSCAGTEGAAIFGCALLTSYLFLFINFYIQTYKKPAVKPSMNGHAKLNGATNGNGVANGIKRQ